ncbi:DUF805 domain-containing protein [Oceanomicrobium pacificus]|uniref:DUF805 domain-containing protein n=1 Tax=Oceanomicrobium pacificus TaxID=2692916 RepID=A0A6B0TYM5_9RHOB|nr:DUF805 domain-containing protein [Oceanomicrobium pacificus]MXU66795.1 DUF805 domain-containing protein [Oceanomicrobium pacificus]
MSFATFIREGLSLGLTFRGRSSRAAYWSFALFAIAMVSVAHLGADHAAKLLGMERSGPSGILGGFLLVASSMLGVFVIYLAIATAAAMVRRLHDTGRSGWWWWIGLVPVIGGLVLLVWAAMPGDLADNRFGPAPGPPEEL